MFSRLRLRLTLLYVLVALALIGLVAGGTLLFLARYFQGVTDLALQHKMTHEFHQLGAPIPKALLVADADWSILRDDVSLLGGSRPRDTIISIEQASQIAVSTYGGRVTEVQLDEEDHRQVYEIVLADGRHVTIDALTGRITDVKSANGKNDDSDDQEHEATPAPALTASPTALPGDSLANASYDAELAAIYVLPLDREGRILFDANRTSGLPNADLDALQSALSQGSDLRTVTIDGTQIRLLTYPLQQKAGPVALQLGRVLSDQQRVMNELFLGVMLLSSISAVLLGFGSWWLAGRALHPAQQAWERQQSFISNASHELRTPLTLMRASAEVAQRHVPATDAEQRELLGDILTEADHMSTLVDDLLMLSRLDSGRLQLTRSPIALDELLSDIQRQTGRLAEERGIRLILGPHTGTVLADRDRLRQVLLIVLDNALRYTAAGGQVTISALPQRNNMVQLSVTDTGAGIPAEHLKHVFERFYRADQARGAASGNVGLGLSIARSLIEAMGGQIGIESTVGKGTSIRVLLASSESGGVISYEKRV